MTNIFKISIVFFIGLSIILSSCKKEVDGCTDSSAMNYLSDATSNDGNCVYAYVIALGTWNITPDCEKLTITAFNESTDIPLDSIFDSTIEITEEGEGVVSMDINGNNVLADVATDGVVTIQDNQTIEFDANNFVPPLEPILGAFIGLVEVVITGSGTIVSGSNGDLSLTLSFEVLGTKYEPTCEITFLR